MNSPTLYNTRCTLIVELTRLGAAQSNDVFSTSQLLLLLLLQVPVPRTLWKRRTWRDTSATDHPRCRPMHRSSRRHGRSRDAACDTVRCIRLRV